MITTLPLKKAKPGGSWRVGMGDEHATSPEMLSYTKDSMLFVFQDPRGLVRALSNGRIKAAVRGHLEPGAALAELERQGGAPLAGRAVLLEPKRQQGVLFGPVGVTEGRGVEQRTRFAALAAEALRGTSMLTEDPLIAVLSAGREGDGKRGKNVAKSLAESEKVVTALTEKGLDAFHAGAQVEEVLRDADVVVAPDGASGNLAFRALHLAAGMKSYGAIVLGSPYMFVDTSRSRKSFDDPIAFASYLARLRAQGKK